MTSSRTQKDTTDAKAKAAEEGVTFTQVALTNEMTAEEKADQAAQAKWLTPSNENPIKKAVLTLLVFYCLWVFLLTLGVMGTGFKLLGGKDSAKMFDVADNPISALMIGILATVLVQSSSTTTSIIVSLVGADELSVKTAIFMIMGANIGTSVTNTIVAMGHFANKDDLRRGFAAATVHDVFNMLNVLIFLPINWIYPFFEKMTYEMAKDQKSCEGDDCNKTEFLKPYISPYSKGVANYDKKVAGYISQNWCAGQCGKSYSTDAMKKISEEVCTSSTDCSNVHKNYESNWMSKGYLAKKRAPAYIVGTASGTPAEFHYDKPAACSTSTKFFDNDTNFTSTVAGSLTAGTCYEVCGSKVKTGLCDKRLLKGGLLLDDWDMTDNGAGTFLTVVSLISLCSCLFCIVYMLQIIVKGTAARILRKVVGFNGYLNIAIGMFHHHHGAVLLHHNLHPHPARGRGSHQPRGHAPTHPWCQHRHHPHWHHGRHRCHLQPRSGVAGCAVPPLLQHLRHPRLVPCPHYPQDPPRRRQVPRQDDHQPQVGSDLPLGVHLHLLLHHPRHRIRHHRRRVLLSNWGLVIFIIILFGRRVRSQCEANPTRPTGAAHGVCADVVGVYLNNLSQLFSLCSVVPRGNIVKTFSRTCPVPQQHCQFRHLL